MCPFRAGTYSSGNCCRFSRHSLLIDQRLKTSFFEPLLGKDIKLDSNKKIFFISGCRFALGTLFIPLFASFFRSYLSLSSVDRVSRRLGESGILTRNLVAKLADIASTAARIVRPVQAVRPWARCGNIDPLRPPAAPSVNISLRVLAFGQSP